MAELGNLKSFSDNFSFPENEKGILKFWLDEQVYKKIVEKNKAGEILDFLDGPAFVSSDCLHYGHMLVGALKSCTLNFANMHGMKVSNKIGYDVHGLPSEEKVSSRLGLKTKKEIETYGIGNYNTKAREMIHSFAGSWQPIYNRMARFLDFKNEYKTMDTPYMETVWWVFKQLWDQGLIYKGSKVMPFSTGCETCLSNFEASGDDIYREVNDPAIFVKFKVKQEENTYFVAWTTTPWTLPSNLALCVNAKLTYVKIKDKKNQEFYILAQDCLPNLYHNSRKSKEQEQERESEYEILSSFLGSELENMEYEPIFSYYQEGRIFKVLNDDLAEAGCGSGIVHLAPSFGMEDLEVCLKKNIIHIQELQKFCPVDDRGHFTEPIKDYLNMPWQEVNGLILERLKREKIILKRENHLHKYPFCWRTDTPLIYKAVSSFFVKVTALKDQLLENNKKVNWVPEYIGSGKFHNWLANVKDWSVSRSRFFGTPLPVWTSDDGEEMICVGSIQELMELSQCQMPITDLHREFIDSIEIPSKQGKGMLKNVKLVLDCWFESGCAPYGQIHYPFNDKDIFDDRKFICDFILEGSDQCRGWFYTLMVLSTALFNKPAFKNVICTGLILAADGKKLSKKLGNYESPENIFNKYSADALRTYLLGSPATHAEAFKFNNEDVGQIVGKLHHWFHTCKFLVEHIIKFEKDGHSFDLMTYKNSTNVMDRWIQANLRTTITCIENEMAAFRISKIIPVIMNFIENLKNWYIRFNRNRFRGRFCSPVEQGQALSTLFRVLFEFAKVTAPFVPYLSETMYQKLKILLPTQDQQISIHLCHYPHAEDFISDPIMELKMTRLQHIAEMVRSIRAKSKDSMSGKVPLKCVTIAHDDPKMIQELQEIERYMHEECNTLQLRYVTSNELYKLRLIPNEKNIGIKFRAMAKEIKMKLMSLTEKEIQEFNLHQKLTIRVQEKEYEMTNEYLTIEKELNVNLNPTEKAMIHNQSGMIVIVDLEQNQEVIEAYIQRLFIITVQKMRKKTSLKPWNKINIYYETQSQEIDQMIKKNYSSIVETLIYKVYPMFHKKDNEKILISEKTSIYNYPISFTICEQP
jgi:isoleucyl-tRNA synthetase